MNRRKNILLAVGLGLIAVAAGFLVHLKSHQRLGLPGIRTAAIPGSRRLDIYLPELVLDYKSELLPQDEDLLRYMPPDTSMAQRRYISADKTSVAQVNVVLMGTDRTSIHKPQFCLTGAGWHIDEAKSRTSVIHMQRPQSYDLPVMELQASKEVQIGGKTYSARAIYVYWFVADKHLTASHSGRMWSMATELLKTGTLERWAYVSVFAICEPGKEDATFDRVQKFIRSAVPQFQTTAGPQSTGALTASN
jgi:hypothetical protein